MLPSKASIAPCILLLFTDIRSPGFSKLFRNKSNVEVLDFVRDKTKADYYKVEKIPATIVEGEEDYGLRF